MELKNKKRVFSGIQPSGEIHIGNYLGAVQKWVEISKEHDCIFCIVDEHAITVDYSPEALPDLVFNAALTSMACGLDPDKCTIFVQSQVPEHMELTWIFNTVTPLGSLFRMSQFKEKSRNAMGKAAKTRGEAQTKLKNQLLETGRGAVKAVEEIEPILKKIEFGDGDGGAEASLIAASRVSSVNDMLGTLMQNLLVGLGISHTGTGLFDYPVLQAADILLYKASLVPVGDDQEQHLELCREIAQRFNRKFGKVFPMPQRVEGAAPKIMGLDGKAKMSKSLGNHIAVLDSPDTVTKKLKGAFTDPKRLRKNDPGRPEICNIFTLHGYFSDKILLDEIKNACKNGSIGCFDCKNYLAKNLNEKLEPIRDKAHKLKENPDFVFDVLRDGSARCRKIAAVTMEEVKELTGLAFGNKFEKNV